MNINVKLLVRWGMKHFRLGEMYVCVCIYIYNVYRTKINVCQSTL